MSKPKQGGKCPPRPVLSASYSYDAKGQLQRENNQAAGKTWVYAYDNGGNITSKKEYAYTTGTLGTVQSTKTYTYGDSTWKDLLTAYNGTTLSYDTIGNLTGDGTWTYTWEHGRQLAGMSKTGTTASFTYNADGLRVSRTVNGTTTQYHYTGDKLTHVTKGSEYLHIYYDALGPWCVRYHNGSSPTIHYYLRNAQGDILGLVNYLGQTVVSYTYDAWGNVLSTTGSMASTLGALNPLRYRSYVYDTETGLYYLSSRYYNPSWGRFISADTPEVATLSPGSATWDKNLFAYCDNDPVNRKDNGGHLWNTIIGALAGALVGGVSAAIAGTDIKAGVVSGALNGAITGAAVDIAIATGGAGLAVFAAVTVAGGFGGATSSYVNQRMNGVARDKIDWSMVAIDGVWGAVGAALSFGVADVGGPGAKTVKEVFKQTSKKVMKKAGEDFLMATTISVGTLLNAEKMKYIQRISFAK